ncbi:MAG: type I methionyl aminopeptidase [Thermoanaerobacteraceae bacterium]|nr:type I methionyl aminopeptidase [Thermoanaerobacteraceae bacterium]
MIIIKSENEISVMRKAGIIVKNTLEFIEEHIRPGVSTGYLDSTAEEFILKQNAYPGFKGYEGFPASICTSINEEVVHGIPSADRILKTGDIISIDVGAIYQGFYGDAARTFPVGEIDETAKRLIEVTRESFFEGIKFARFGYRLYDISNAIQTHVETNGFSVVRDYVGHGIGRDMHEDPQIPNYGPKGKGPRLLPGMALAIEPMVNAGSYRVKTLPNKWTVITADKSLSAHYENTIVITENEPEILTL